MNYRYILFDLDGTITESAPGIINSACYALEKMGCKVTDKNDLKKFIGPPLNESMEKYYGMTPEDALRAVAYFREYFSVTGIFENSVYEGFLETLDILKAHGKILAIATSKPEEYAKRIADKFGFTDYFEGIYGATMDNSRVHKGDVIHYALESLGLSGNEDNRSDKLDHVLMVGDRSNDILGAKANGLASMGVLYGYGSREELESAGADYIVETTLDVARIILE